MDLENFVGLSDSLLREVVICSNIAFMKEYGSEILCGECSSKINRADDTIKYFHRRLHIDCFKSVYKTERFLLEEKERLYFDRIERLF